MPDQDPHHERITLQGVSLAGTGHRRRFAARFVRVGRVRAAGNRQSNIEVTEKALLSSMDRKLFDNKAVFVDHAGFFEYPSMRNLAAVTSDARYNEKDKAVEGTINFYSQAEDIAKLLDEILSDANAAPDIGLSIVFWPMWEVEEGSKLRKIVDIRHVESIDVVFEPAADGRILEALSAAAQVPLSGGTTMPEELNTVQPESDAAQQQQPAGDPNALVGEWLTTMATASAGVMIANSGLPAAARERLSAQTFNNPEEVNTAIDQERQYLAALQEADVIQGMGGPAPRTPQISGGMSGFEELKLAFSAMLQGKNPPSGVRPLSGIRELYLHLSGDYEMNGMFHSDRITFANVNSSTMASMTADELNKIVANEFQVYPRWWEKIIIQEDFQSLQSVKWVTLGGVGELPTVAEGAAYTELTWDDMKETGTFLKKGATLG